MELKKVLPPDFAIYPRSLQHVEGTELAIVYGPGGRQLLTSSTLEGIHGQRLANGGMLCPLSIENARSLGRILPWLSPCCVPEGMPAFGFGDRIGLATPGHAQALEGMCVFPILAQQSVRENRRTGSTFEDVLARAVFGALQAGYRGGFGADADHLKSTEDARQAVGAGYSFFTCDPSDHVVDVDALTTSQLAMSFRSLPDAERLRTDYLGTVHEVPGLGRLALVEDTLVRAAVKYGGAVGFAIQMYETLASMCGASFDFELSVDETQSPTSPEEHFFVGTELQRAGVKLSSLAPRFPGAMEKGIDWIGDLLTFREVLAAHTAIAKALGGYRLGLHSGSDKFSLYPLMADKAPGLWHVKTAGTSYLVALEVAARIAPSLFREIAAFSLLHFPEERDTYHLSTDVKQLPDIPSIADEGLPVLLSHDPTRQMLHVGYGVVLQSALGDDLLATLGANERTYHDALSRHLRSHLTSLKVGSDG